MFFPGFRKRQIGADLSDVRFVRAPKVPSCGDVFVQLRLDLEEELQQPGAEGRGEGGVGGGGGRGGGGGEGGGGGGGGEGGEGRDLLQNVILW